MTGKRSDQARGKAEQLKGRAKEKFGESRRREIEEPHRVVRLFAYLEVDD